MTQFIRKAPATTITGELYHNRLFTIDLGSGLDALQQRWLHTSWLRLPTVTQL